MLAPQCTFALNLKGILHASECSSAHCTSFHAFWSRQCSGSLSAGTRSHKGSALALLVELLGGAWPGGAVRDKLSSQDWGSLVVAIQPSILGDAAAFKQRVSELCGRIKGARKGPGVQEILLPGERSSKLAGEDFLTMLDV